MIKQGDKIKWENTDIEEKKESGIGYYVTKDIDVPCYWVELIKDKGIPRAKNDFDFDGCREVLNYLSKGNNTYKLVDKVTPEK